MRRSTLSGCVGVAAAFVTVLLAACESFLTQQITRAPNATRSLASVSADDALFARSYGVDRIERVDVGPPAATIACWVVEPKDQQPVRGTIFVLHGVGDGPTWMAGKARTLADEGYRSVLVSLRGYAGSTGNERTFTVLERRDLVQVLDALEARGVAIGPIGVWGMSYGAATAIAWAGEDPRVRAVVAVAGFSSMREIVPHVTRTLLPLFAFGRDDAQFQQIVDDAAARAGFDADDADLTRSMRKTSAAVLIMHGECDAIVPFAHGERLAASGNANTRFVRIPLRGHIGAWSDLDGFARREGIEWFARWFKAPEGPSDPQDLQPRAAAAMEEALHSRGAR